MADGINVSIGADTNPFGQAVKGGMIDPLEDAQKTLEELGSGSAGAKLESTLRDQQRQTVALKGDIEQLNDTIRTGSRRATTDAGTSFQGFTRHTEEGFNEVRESARSNAIETAASFTGGFDQIAGGAQGLAAEVFAGFGPAGVVAGLAAAAGIGAITTAIDAGTTSAETQQEAVKSLAQEYIDAGESGTRSFDAVRQSISDMATSKASDVILTLQDAYQLASDAGTDYEGVVQAIASGSPAEIGRAKAAVDELTAAHTKSYEAALRSGDGTARAAFKGEEAATKLAEKLDAAKKAATQAGRAQELAAAAGISDLQLKTDLLEQLHDGYKDAAGATTDYLDKEGDLKVGAYIKNMARKRKALKDYEEELETGGLSAKAKAFLESQGADAAATLVAGYKNASPKQQAQLDEIWTTAGTTNAKSYGDTLGANLSKVKIPAPKIAKPVVPAPDTAALDAFIRNPKTYRVIVEGVTRNGQRVF